MKTDIFLCYRRPGAQTAKLVKRYFDSIQLPFKVWYSDKERVGNYKLDIPELIDSSKCVIMFVDDNFTKDFLKKTGTTECITKYEIIEIEKKIQRDSDYLVVIVALNGLGFTKKCSKDLELLFKENGIFRENSVQYYVLRNKISFNPYEDDESLLFDEIVHTLINSKLLENEKFFGNFYFGNKQTYADIIVWDQEKGIKPENISFTLSMNEQPQLYTQIDRIKVKDIEVSHNNDMVSVTNFYSTLTNNREDLLINIEYLRNSYEQFKKTLMIWNSSGLGINQKVGTYSIDNNKVYEVPNAMGLAFMVVTKDNYLLFTRRSCERGIRPNECDVSIVEGLKLKVESEIYNYDINDTNNYVLNEIKRAYREEVCFYDEEIKVKINGIVLDKEYGQWNIVGTIFSSDTSSDIIRKHPLRGDSFEKIAMEFIPLLNENNELTLDYLKPMTSKFIEHKFWSMGYATLYGALKDVGFTDKDILNLVNNN